MGVLFFLVDSKNRTKQNKVCKKEPICLPKSSTLCSVLYKSAQSLSSNVTHFAFGSASNITEVLHSSLKESE